jgi:hypothetical protein
MMAGTGPFGPLEMGGMFTMLKVRADQARGDYKDPGWYAHPAGTQAREWSGEVPPAAGAPGAVAPDGDALKVRKPRGHGH